MNVTSVHCNNCGAPLQIPDTTQFVTCNYCGARLRIQRTATSTFSEVLDQIAAKADHIERDLEVVKLQNEIEKLDRDWEARRRELCVVGEHGALIEPNMQLEIQYIIGVIFGIGWMIFAHSTGAPVFFVLFGLLPVISTIYRLSTLQSKISAYSQEKQTYLNRHARLEHDLASQGGT